MTDRWLPDPWAGHPRPRPTDVPDAPDDPGQSHPGAVLPHTEPPTPPAAEPDTYPADPAYLDGPDAYPDGPDAYPDGPDAYAAGLDTDGDGLGDTLVGTRGADLVLRTDLDGDGHTDQELRIGPGGTVRYADPDPDP